MNGIVVALLVVSSLGTEVRAEREASRASALGPWREEATFELSSDAGVFLAGSADTVVVGGGLGKLEVYQRAGAAWKSSASITLKSSELVYGEVVVDGDDLVVAGGPEPWGGARWVEAFHRAGGEWSPVAFPSEDLGVQVVDGLDLADGRLVVGAVHDVDACLPDFARILVYARDGGSWVREAEVTSTLAGGCLSLSAIAGLATAGDRIFVGADLVDPGTAEAEILRVGPSGWEVESTVSAAEYFEIWGVDAVDGRMAMSAWGLMAVARSPRSSCAISARWVGRAPASW